MTTFILPHAQLMTGKAVGEQGLERAKRVEEELMGAMPGGHEPIFLGVVVTSER